MANPTGRGGFRKGQSGNPGGRPRVIGDLRDLARKHTAEAVEELARLALKAKSETARVAAIRELLDRGYGRPESKVDATVRERPTVVSLSHRRG
jgi:hypothetical protein